MSQSMQNVNKGRTRFQLNSRKKKISKRNNIIHRKTNNEQRKKNEEIVYIQSHESFIENMSLDDDKGEALKT
jgi:hypothetical protein